MSNKRILFICNTDPELKNGGGIATKAYIRTFCDLYPGKVDLILPAISKESDLLVNFFFVPSRKKSHKYSALFTGSIHRYRNYVIDFLKQNAETYFLCVFNGSIVGGDLVDFTLSLNIKTLTIHHNYEKEYHVDNKSLESFKGLFPFFVIRNERNAFLKSDINFFLTICDKNKLHSVYGEPNGTSFVTGVFESEIQNDLKLFYHRTTYMNNGITLVISGSLNTYQTEAGIFDFHKNYFQLIKGLKTNFCVIITGRNPNPKLLDLFFKENSVRIVADPVDINEIVRKGDVYLCPTNIGSGMKLRVLDGLQNGLPVLVHKVSARGYDELKEKPWFKIYEDSDSFVEGLNSIINWIKKGNSNSQEIINTYKNYFGYEQGLEKVKRILLSLKINNLN